MSPSPPSPCGSDVDEPSMGRLSLRTHRSIRSGRRLSGPTAASMPTAPTPVDPTAASISTTATPVELEFSTRGPSYASVVGVPKPEPQQESGSESDLELDRYKQVKYELISAITSCGILDRKGCYGHVNFTAKGNQKNSKEELFFAELRYSYNTCVPTCVLSLDGVKTIGGLCGSKYDNWKNGFFIDAKHCYACGCGLKHPKNGALYEIGHVADSEYYHLEEG